MSLGTRIEQEWPAASYQGRKRASYQGRKRHGKRAGVPLRWRCTNREFEAVEYKVDRQRASTSGRGSTLTSSRSHIDTDIDNYQVY